MTQKPEVKNETDDAWSRSFDGNGEPLTEVGFWIKADGLDAISFMPFTNEDATTSSVYPRETPVVSFLEWLSGVRVVAFFHTHPLSKFDEKPGERINMGPSPEDFERAIIIAITGTIQTSVVIYCFGPGTRRIK